MRALLSLKLLPPGPGGADAYAPLGMISCVIGFSSLVARSITSRHHEYTAVGPL